MHLDPERWTPEGDRERHGAVAQAGESRRSTLSLSTRSVCASDHARD
nr:hypothetical protein [Halovivax sp. KZCA124]